MNRCSDGLAGSTYDIDLVGPFFFPSVDFLVMAQENIENVLISPCPTHTTET
jgi:hypothetical protein